MKFLPDICGHGRIRTKIKLDKFLCAESKASLEHQYTLDGQWKI